MHGTTRADKYWPEDYWIQLAKKLIADGFRVSLPWGNEEEHLRAERIAVATGAEVLPKLKLTELAALIANAKAVIAVDTGLGHLTAALDVPCISLYGPTSPLKVGAYGKGQKHLVATNGESMQAITAEQVFAALASLLQCESVG